VVKRITFSSGVLISDFESEMVGDISEKNVLVLARCGGGLS